MALCILILNILILMVLGVAKNYHSISLSFKYFKYLNLIDFVTWILSANKLHRECSNKSEPKLTLWHIHSILNFL